VSDAIDSLMDRVHALYRDARTTFQGAAQAIVDNIQLLYDEVSLTDEQRAEADLQRKLAGYRREQVNLEAHLLQLMGLNEQYEEAVAALRALYDQQEAAETAAFHHRMAEEEAEELQERLAARSQAMAASMNAYISGGIGGVTTITDLQAAQAALRAFREEMRAAGGDAEVLAPSTKPSPTWLAR
jgi:hypothetical protein